MRFTRFLFAIAIIVIAVGAIGAVAFRATRGKFSPPETVKPGIYGEQNAIGIYLYGARTAKGAILFDTGVDPEARPVDGLLAAMGAARSDVRAIFLTHGHFDHTAGAVPFSKTPIYLGAGDMGLASGAVSPDAVAAQLFSRVAHNPPITVSNPLRGATAIDVGDGKSVRAFPVPGHTAGSYVFLYDGVLFCGDIMVLKQGRLETTPAAFDAHPAENRAAIRSLKTQLGAETVETICTAHGGCTPKGMGASFLDDLIARMGASS